MWNMSNFIIDEVSTLISNQLQPDARFHGAVLRIRRFITTVHPELLDDFIALAEAEHLSGGYQKAGTEEIRRRLERRAKTQLGRIRARSVRELTLGGDEIMKILQIPPGPQVGKVLNYLFDMVQEDPDLNTRERLARISGGGKIRERWACEQ